MKLIVFVFSFFSILTLLASCSKSIEQVVEPDYNTLVTSATSQSKINRHIVTFEIHRPKTNCEKGFGICNVRWFYCTDDQGRVVECTPDHSWPQANGFTGPLQLDPANGQYYIEMHFTSDVSALPVEQTTFVVDYDVTLDAKKELGVDLTLPANSHPYDPSIGNYGGHRLYFTAN